MASPGVERNTKLKASGHSQPNSVGPRMMPMMISPTAADWPQRSARLAPMRPASTITHSCSSVKNSSSSLLCTPDSASLATLMRTAPR